MTPAAKYFWTNGYTIISGTADTVMMTYLSWSTRRCFSAASAPEAEAESWLERTRFLSTTCRGILLSSCMNIRALKKVFHMAVA